jgi:hypothetical protein
MDALLHTVESSESDYDDAADNNDSYEVKSTEEVFINNHLPTWKALLFRTSSNLGMQLDVHVNKD